MPGLLCFVIDGLHTETLASVRTPHLDRLGRRGASCRRLLAPPPALTLPALTTLSLQRNLKNKPLIVPWLTC